MLTKRHQRQTVLKSHRSAKFCLMVGWLLVLATFIVLPGERTSAADAPFVASYDRFGRHNDISEHDAGRLLLSELSCTACHATPDAILKSKQGPVLDVVGSRVQKTWLKQFLTAPESVKPGTTMPDALANVPASIKANVVDALVAFLATQTAAFPEIKATGLNPVPFEFWTKGDVETGKDLYHQTGCVACHQPAADYEVAAIKPSSLDEILEQLDPEEIEELGLASAARRVNSVPHGDLPAKYTLQSLTHFLLNPEAVRAGGRMPNFDLTAMDAAHVAAYLMADKSESDPGQAVAAAPEISTEEKDRLVVDGRRWFTSLGCANCHAIRGLEPKQTAKPLAELNAKAGAACWTKPGTEIWQPFFALDEMQITAVKRALLPAPDSSKEAKGNELNSRLLSLNCYACHQRDELGGVGRYRKSYFETVGHVDIGDEGRLPPELTNVGRKMQPAWLNDVMAGKARVRLHMHIRMPQFPSPVVKPLPALFVKADGGDQRLSENQVFGDADLAALEKPGRLLMDVGCVQCHSFRGESLPGTVGIDLQGISKRVQPEWFRNFLLDPGALKPRTRMPTFFPGGQSQLKDLLDGDVDLQIAAMWAYLRALERQPLPAKIVEARARDYELTPEERPIVIRTFMKQAGTHAIAVGFSQKRHFAFDANAISLALAWRGRFLDAEGTWFIRFAPPAAPLGDDVVRFPAGPALAVLERDTAPWPVDADSAGARFSGYRLDKAGVPTFLYKVHRFAVEDRIAPGEGQTLKGQTLKRQLVIRRPSVDETTGAGPAIKTLWLRAHADVSLTRNSPTSVTGRNGLRVDLKGAELSNGQNAIGQIRTGEISNSNDGQEWLIPVDVDAMQTIELEYQW